MSLSASSVCCAQIGEPDSEYPLFLKARNINTKVEISGEDYLKMYETAKNGDDSIIDVLLQFRADTENGINFTALHVASRNGDAVFLDRLLGHSDADIIGQDLPGGVTALQVSVFKNNLDCAEILLKHGANPDQFTPPDGVTCLALAAHRNYLPLVEILLKYRATVDKPGHSGATPLILASIKNHASVMEILLNHGAMVDQVIFNCTVLSLVVDRNHIEAVEILLKHGADANKPSVKKIDSGEVFMLFPLCSAVKKGFKEVAKLLLDKGADMNKRMLDDVPLSTTLVMARKSGNADMLNILTSHASFVAE
ncbi:MAG: ankyrin repeat domain-containing protein [Alphaproteobacteria bacterium]|nr:ankyrin repeat domain-containing protein [Alphaproteobacteria bacterium]